jgi:hypothetical protein
MTFMRRYWAIAVVALFGALLICTCKSESQSISSWNKLLRNEDFGTGLLAQDLSKDQGSHMQKAIAAMGFTQVKDTGAVDDKQYPSQWTDYVKHEVDITYWWSIDGRGTLHSLTIQRHNVKPGEFVNIKGIPQELSIGAPLRAVIAKWGLGDKANRNEYKRYKHDKFKEMQLRYYAKYEDRSECIWVGIVDDSVASISLEIWLGPLSARVSGVSPTAEDTRQQAE